MLSLLSLSCTQENESTIFKELTQKTTGITFSNDLIDSDSLNILEYLYFYNGGGVATGDINNDGLPDIYFGSNMGSDKLYLNQGNFNFVDVSDRLPQDDLLGWTSGVTMVDINSDGYLDIYVCRVGKFKHLVDHNKLFINNEGVKFTEASNEYGLDFSTLSTQASFLDYDQDGDLDCYLLNHSLKDPSQFQPAEIRQIRDTLYGDRFLENENGQFVDVTEASNIYSSNIGFGLGIEVCDFNGDGWQDIYIGNDFHEQDYLYINNKDKTFSEVIETATGHTSNFSMGCSANDLNNDLQPDIITLDMKPYDVEIYKKSGGWESMQIYNYKRKFGYHHQSPKNSVQVFEGLKNDIPYFSEQASYYDLSATDWSWSPLIHDFDNDGDKDIFITNGIVKRPNDLDYVKFHFDGEALNKLSQLQFLPSGFVPNIYVSNESDKDQFNKNYIGEKNATTGAAVADFNNDGILDIVLNKINAPATVLTYNQKESADYISIGLKGSEKNTFGLGSKVELYQGEKAQLNYIKSSSGFQSFSEPIAHFGIGPDPIDSLVITWANGIRQVVLNVSKNKRTIIEQQDGLRHVGSNSFSTDNSIEGYKHSHKLANNQVAEKWLLYDPECKQDIFSEFDQDNILVVNDNEIQLLNTTENKLVAISLPFLNTGTRILHCEKIDKHTFGLIGKNGADCTLYIFDANREFEAKYTLEDLPLNQSSVFSINDYNKDGKPDLFIGGAYEKGHYGQKHDSRIFNITENGFDTLDLNGIVYDADWIDINNDGWEDLIISGHWMPVTIFYNNEGQLEKTEIPNSSGLWFESLIEDVDNNGYLDILVGNFGLNHDLNVSKAKPLISYYNDFDLNGQKETLITCIEEGKEIPYFGHETFTDQLPYIKRNYLKSKDFAKATAEDLVGNEKMNESYKKEVVELRSGYYLQTENGFSSFNPFPSSVQKFPILNIERNTETYIFSGNLSEIDPNLGRQDGGFISLFEFEDNTWIEKNDWKTIPFKRGDVIDMHVHKNFLYYVVKNGKMYFYNL
ncbi:MAG: VCBS repeat-containing protein [Saprospiraceae bacterium]|nr:VCBS repeat-containing protein [Bacteroidia bacterium]NNL91964.1 VCBS repeat-containing protein [Saprospiraceae bacterium]